MKTNRLISIALVTVMALTVVSGAGMMTAQAFTWVGTPPTSDEIAEALDCSDLGVRFTLSGEGSGDAVLTASAESGYTYYHDGDGLAAAYSTDVQSGATASITLTTEVVGPGTVIFGWYAGAEPVAQTKLDFFINPTDATPAASAAINGYVRPSMTDVTPITVPDGTHQLTWRISTEGSGVNVAAYLDYLRFTPAVTKDTVKTEITTLQGYTQPAMFTNNNHKAFDAKLTAVYKLVDAGTATSYAQAMDKIQIDLMPKTDGVAPDWVTGTDSQGVSYQLTVYNALETLYGHIKTLQTVGFPV